MRHCAVDETELLELGEDLGQALLLWSLLSVSTTTSAFGGRLVGIVDAGEVLDLAGERLLVEALGVARGERVDGARAIHLAEAPPRGAALLVADLAVGADRGGDGARARARDELRHEADAANVGVAIFFGEAEPFGQVHAHLVAVERLDVQPALRDLAREHRGQGRFPRSRRAQ